MHLSSRCDRFCRLSKTSSKECEEGRRLLRNVTYNETAAKSEIRNRHFIQNTRNNKKIKYFLFLFFWKNQRIFFSFSNFFLTEAFFFKFGNEQTEHNILCLGYGCFYRISGKVFIYLYVFNYVPPFLFIHGYSYFLPIIFIFSYILYTFNVFPHAHRLKAKS